MYRLLRVEAGRAGSEQHAQAAACPAGRLCCPCGRHACGSPHSPPQPLPGVAGVPGCKVAAHAGPCGRGRALRGRPSGTASQAGSPRRWSPSTSAHCKADCTGAASFPNDSAAPAPCSPHIVNTWPTPQLKMQPIRLQRRGGEGAVPAAEKATGGWFPQHAMQGPGTAPTTVPLSPLPAACIRAPVGAVGGRPMLIRRSPVHADCSGQRKGREARIRRRSQGCQKRQHGVHQRALAGVGMQRALLYDSQSALMSLL